AAYLAASADVDATRREAARLAEAVEGRDYNDTNYIFPTYIVTELPKGLTGLVIAVIFAAAMTALSGELSSLATASMVDFSKPFGSPGGDEGRALLVSRVLPAGWGAFACLVALQAGRLGSAIEVVNRLGSYFYGSILGVFGLAVLTPRASARGAFYGLFFGVAAVLAVSLPPPLHFLCDHLLGAGAPF